MKIIFYVYGFLVLGLTGCTNSALMRSTIGNVGCVTSQAIHKYSGYRTNFCETGSIAGDLLSRKITDFLNEAEKRKMAAAANKSLIENKPITWQSPDRADVSGTISHGEMYTVKGNVCRKRTVLVNAAGKEKIELEEVCRMSDGSWVPTNAA